MKLATLQTILLAILALSSGVLAARSLSTEGMPRLLPPSNKVADWRSLQHPSSPLMQGDGSITIIEFSDFQCPFCRNARATLHALAEKYPNRVTIHYRHLPLSMHAHAIAAAEASECAGDQGTFTRFHDVLFEQQDSIGTKSWDSFARDAGVRDLAAFSACVAARTHAERVRQDSTAAARAGFSATPTFIVNGRLVRGALPLAEFEKHVD